MNTLALHTAVMHTDPADQGAPPRPQSPRPNRTPWIVAGALAVALFLGGIVSIAAMAHHGRSVLPHQASAADAQQTCKTAIETDAQGRVTRVNDGPDNGTIASMDSVEVDQAVPTAGGFTVNGTEHFSVASILGAFPHAVLVVCTATPTAGGALSATVDNR